MISKIEICKNCKAEYEVTTWRKFSVCPYCNSEMAFEGFGYKTIDRQDSMYVHMKWEQDCPVCRSKHMLASSRVGKYHCVDCHYMLSGMKKMFMILWFCDRCETFMNIQEGFTTKNKRWICTECRYDNDVTKNNIV